MTERSWQERINEIFATTAPPEANAETMTVYLRHLRANLEHPCYLMQTHEETLRAEPLLLLDLAGDVDPEQGILARVCRSSDGREFTMPLSELECCEDSSPNSDLVEDFSRWFMYTMLRRMSGFEV